MDRVIPVIMLFFSFPQHAPGKGFLEVTLVQFDNNNGKTWTGNCCDSMWSGSTCDPNECDTYFDICLQDIAFLAAGGCGFGQRTTGVIQNNDHITFGSDIGGTVNPINFAFESWKGAVLKIEAIDDDIQEGRDSADDKIDNVQLLIVGTPDPNGVQKNVIRQNLQGNRIRMQIEYNILCRLNYYGDCSVYCQPVPGRYACSDSGAKICYAGWTGGDCSINIDECLTHTCQHGATCEDNLNGFICTCLTGYTGYLCELEIPFTTRTNTSPTPPTTTTTPMTTNITSVATTRPTTTPFPTTTITATQTAVATTQITTANIPTVQSTTTFTDKALSTSVVVSISKNNSMKTNTSMTTAPVLESTASSSSPFVTTTTIKTTTTNINLPCKVVLVNSSDPGMVRVQHLNASRLDVFQSSLLQRLQNITGLQANQLEIHLLNKIQNQNGQINVSFFVTSTNTVLINSVLYDAVQDLCSPAKLRSTNQQQQNDDDSDIGVMVGVVIGSLLGLAALCGLLFMLVKRKKERQNKVSHSYTVEKQMDRGYKSGDTLIPKTKDNTANISREEGDGVSLEMHQTEDSATYSTAKKDFNVAETDRSIGHITSGTHQKETSSVVHSIIHVRPDPSNNSIETLASVIITSLTAGTMLNEKDTSNETSNNDTQTDKTDTISKQKDGVNRLSATKYYCENANLSTFGNSTETKASTQKDTDINDQKTQTNVMSDTENDSRVGSKRVYNKEGNDEDTELFQGEIKTVEVTFNNSKKFLGAKDVYDTCLAEEVIPDNHLAPEDQQTTVAVIGDLDPEPNHEQHTDGLKMDNAMINDISRMEYKNAIYPRQNHSETEAPGQYVSQQNQYLNK